MNRGFQKVLAIALMCGLLVGGISSAALATERAGLTMETFEAYLQEVFDTMPVLEFPEIDMELVRSQTADNRTQFSSESEGKYVLARSFPDSEVMEYGWCGAPANDEDEIQAYELQVCCMTSLVPSDGVLERIGVLSETQEKALEGQEMQFTANDEGYLFYAVGEYTVYLFFPEDDLTMWAFWWHQDATWTIEELYAKSQEAPEALAVPEKQEDTLSGGLGKTLGMLAQTRGVSLDAFEKYLDENVQNLCKANSTAFESAQFTRTKTQNGAVESMASIGAQSIGGRTFPGSDIVEFLWMAIPAEGETDLGDMYFAGFCFSAVNDADYWTRLTLADALFDELQKAETVDEDGNNFSSATLEDYTVYVVMMRDESAIAFLLHKNATLTYQEAEDFVMEKLAQP